MQVRPVALFIALLAWAVPGLAARPVVSLRSDLWCPYNCTPGAARPGYAVEVAQIVFNAAGYDVDYQLLNWTRSVEDARLGYTDGVIGAFGSDAPGFLLPHEPIGRSAIGFAVRRGDPFRYTSVHALDRRVLGITATYEFTGPLGAYVNALHGDAARVQYVSGNGALALNLAKLVAGRVDVVLDDSLVMARAIQDQHLSGQVTIGGATPSVPIYIAFSPASPRSPVLAETLSRGIASLRQSGRLAAILARYGLQDWQ